MTIRTAFQDVRNIPDPAQTSNWDLIIPRVPVAGSARELTIRIQTSQIPAIQFNKVTTQLKTARVHHRGYREYEGTLETNVVEARDMQTRSILEAWSNLMHDPIANTGSYKATYAIDGVEALVYDDIPNVIRRFVFFGFWPQTVAGVPLGSEATGIVFPVTWSYDYFREFAV